MEIETKNSSSYYNVVTLGKNGLILFNENKNYKNEIKEWKFARYDSLFKEIWVKTINIQKPLEFYKYYYDTGLNNLYILFVKGKKYGYSETYTTNHGTFEIISLNLSDGEFKVIKGNIKGRADFFDFKVYGNTAFLGGNSKPGNSMFYLNTIFSLTFIPLFTGVSFYKFKPIILAVDMNTGKTVRIVNNAKGQSYMLSEEIVSSNNSSLLTGVGKNIVSGRRSSLFINNYDSEGNIINRNNIQLSSDSTIVSAKLFSFNGENYFAGTYNNMHRHFLRFNPFYHAASEMSLPSKGIYFSKFENGKIDFMKFYSFKNFQAIAVNSKLKEQIRSDINKKINNSDYQFLLHNIIRKNNENLLIAEAFYPEYHTEYFWTTDIYGRTFQESRDIFDGYRYTHAIITSFDDNGKLLWDNNFEIWNIISYNLKERVKVLFDNDDIVLAYSNEGKIESKIIHKNNVIQPKAESPTDLNQNLSTANINVTSDMELWYDNFFITYGYQRSGAKPNSKDSKTVFYINKIAFQ